MQRRIQYGRRMVLALTVLSLGAFVSPAKSQECPTFTGESFRWKDPITKTCNAPALTTKPRLRRGGTIRLTVVRNGINFTDRTGLVQQNTGVTFVAEGNTGGIGFITVDINLAGAGLVDRILRFPHITGGFAPTVAIVRRGEILDMSQAPDPAPWGGNVSITVTGRDIGNAGVEVPGHTVSVLSNSDTELKLTARATGTTPLATAAVQAWDKGFTKLAVRYADIDAPTAIAYAAQAGTAPCVQLPSIEAPTLSGPPNGGVGTEFASATDPIKANTVFAWQQVGDPQRKYILHLEASMVASSTLSATTTKSTSTVTLAPVITEEPVGPVSSTSNTATVQRALTRHRVYKWKVRAVNCGVSTPWSAVRTYTVK